MIAHTLTSSWGKRNAEIDVRALRRYQTMLLRIFSVGEILIFTLIAVLVVTMAWFIGATNFENVIFYDGTDAICVLDGKTGEITDVR